MLHNVYFQSCMEHRNTLCWENAGYLNVNNVEVDTYSYSCAVHTVSEQEQF